jgi:hypothetical protein
MSVMDALEAVYKADPATAESMIDDIVLDALTDEALDNAALLNKSTAAFVGQRVAVAKRALLRQYVSEVARGRYPDDEVHKASAWLAGIEAFAVDAVVAKDDPPAIWDLQDERKHRRDARGRFSRGVNQGARRDPTQYQNIQQVAQPVRTKIKAEGDSRKLTDENERDKVERTQAQYEQADEILREFGAAFTSAERKNINAMIQYQDASGNIKTLAAPLDVAAHGMPDSAYGNNRLGIEDTIISIEIDPKSSADDELRQRVHRFNTLGAMGGQQLASIGSLSNENRSALTSALMPRGAEQGKLGSLFSRFKSGAGVLDATGHDKMGAFARFAGTYGPEAEKVLDPRVRQAAYRYRGTEKEPDIELMRAMNSTDMNVVEAAAREGGHGQMSEQVMAQSRLLAVGREGRGDRPATSSPVAGSLRHNLERAAVDQEPLTEDQINMRVRSDVAAIHLLKTIPADRMIGDLSRKAGAILPSQGVLIDADGDVVSQAVGSGDDTYLPFDYNNIKRSMRGGQYVRTRVQGGLTGEDIAAAVGNGARMATVVSSSGVHSIEFDPNLRGARGGSDKARSMYRRYLQILDAVENSGMYTQDIDPREKAKLRSQAAQITGTREGDDFKSAYKKLEADARASASELSEEEMDGLMAQAVTQVDASRPTSPQQRQRLINDVYTEMEEKASNEKASQLRLNAEGYQVALQTLQQQFPYFIRNVSYEPLAGTKGEKGFLDSRGQPTPGGVARQRLKATDEGYVRPGGIRASSVRGGFYRTETPQPGAAEGTTGMKQAVGGQRFNEEREAKAKAEAKVAEGGAPGAPGTPGGPGAPGLNGPTTGPQGGLSASAARYAGTAEANKKKAVGEIKSIFSALDAQRLVPRVQPTWEELASNPNTANKDIALWALTQNDPTAPLQDPAKAHRVSVALSDRAAVKGALKDALDQGPGGDFFGPEGARTGNKFGTADSPEAAAEYLADLALQIVDAGLLTQPFVNPRGEGGKIDPYHVGDRPQDATIAGVSTNSLDTPEKFQAALNSNLELKKLAASLGSMEGSDAYAPASAMQRDVVDRIKTLKGLPGAIATARTEVARGASGGMQTEQATNFLNNMGIPAEDALAAMERMYGSRPRTAADLVKLQQDHPNFDAQARQLQEAWALVVAGRTQQAVMGQGDVSNPKAGEGLLFKAASTRRASIVRKSRDSSPLAQEISRRRLAGLQYVPTRV